MKKFTNKTITPKIQEQVALHVQEFIKSNFEQVTHNKEELLKNNINFMTEKGLNENIFNQTILKSSYPRCSFSYKQIATNMPNLSKKIQLAAPNDKSDFRLIGELKTASFFAETSSIIQKVIMNSESPKKSITINAIITPGNKNKDITLQLETKNKSLLPIEMDIKAGNNANNPFSGILAEIPYSTNHEPYCIMNDPISLINIQQQRMTYLSTLQQNVKAQEICIFIKHLDKLPLDDIQKNMLIQEKMFKLMSENLLSQRPSFYHAYLIDKQLTVQQLFLEKVMPYIKPDIFDNLKNAKIFIAQAIKIYNITINDVTSNIIKSKQVWMGTGFEDIADDIFK